MCVYNMSYITRARARSAVAALHVGKSRVMPCVSQRLDCKVPQLQHEARIIQHTQVGTPYLNHKPLFFLIIPQHHTGFPALLYVKPSSPL